MLMQCALGTIEKISIKRKAQDVMLKRSIIAWILDVLKNAAEINETTIEYTTALLMNLSLRTEGKRKCCELKSDILKVLKSFILTDNQQIQTHVNGTLYSLFLCPAIQKEARVLYIRISS